jgi:hypothetical protein
MNSNPSTNTKKERKRNACNTVFARCGWLTPVILAIWETEIGRIEV